MRASARRMRQYAAAHSQWCASFWGCSRFSVKEIQAAVAAMRADLPQIRSQHLTHIHVINSNTVYLSYREAGEYFSTPHVVKRVGGYWHHTGHIVMGLPD
jgi:hypothetical protein